jgi:hypothetical protein
MKQAQISPGNLSSTAIFDFEHPAIQAFAKELGSHRDQRSLLQAAHGAITQRVRPVYSVDERQPASVTLNIASGSCSQRMALLEAVARARGIPTRVHALHIKGRFWYPRFRWLRPFLPRRVLLMWPQFFIGGAWIGLEDVYLTVSELAAQGACRFSNDGETLFEAVQHSPVDFFGRCQGRFANADLSAFVVADLGIFPSRDQALEQHGSLGDTLRGQFFNSYLAGRTATEKMLGSKK